MLLTSTDMTMRTNTHLTAALSRSLCAGASNSSMCSACPLATFGDTSGVLRGALGCLTAYLCNFAFLWCCEGQAVAGRVR